MYVLSIIVSSFLIFLGANLASAETANPSNLVDDYLASYTSKYSEDFILGAYCYGILSDVGIELETWGDEDGNSKIKKFGSLILKRADKHYEDYLFLFLDEIDPEYLSIEEPTDDRTAQAIEKMGSAIADIADSDLYYHVYDKLNTYEFFGIYGLCSNTFTPNGVLSRDVSLEKFLKVTDGKKPFLKKVADKLSSAKVLVIEWTKTKYTQISSIDMCAVNDGFAGGAFIGTATTSLLAGESVVAIVTSGGILVASAPAIATGVTVSALAGSAIYLGKKGYCYVTDK